MSVPLEIFLRVKTFLLIAIARFKYIARRNKFKNFKKPKKKKKKKGKRKKKKTETKRKKRKQTKKEERKQINPS